MGLGSMSRKAILGGVVLAAGSPTASEGGGDSGTQGSCASSTLEFSCCGGGSEEVEGTCLSLMPRTEKEKSWKLAKTGSPCELGRAVSSVVECTPDNCVVVVH